MAWGKNQNWKWQLRDRKGRWIEMGRGVKWYSPSLGREVSGTVVGQKGKNAVVNLTSEPVNAKTGQPQQVSVKGSDIEVIENKATLNPTADKAISATDAMLKQGQRPAPKAIVNKASAPAKVDTIETKLDDLEEVTVQADEGTLKGDALKKALDDAKFGITGEKGGKFTVSAGKDENKEWNFLVTDDKGTGVDNIPMGVDDTKGVMAKIDKSIKDHEKANADSAEADQNAPEAPKDENYNDNGLTAEEQKLSDGYVRMADRADKAGKYDAADNYRAQNEALLKTGQDRKAAPASDQKAEVPAAPETPEAVKPVENAPEAAKTNVPLADLETQAKADGDTVLYHGGLPAGTTLDGIDLNRNGTQQNKRGSSFGGFYLTDESSKSWSDKYAMERNGVMHGFAIDKNARIDDRGKEQIDRISAEDRAKAAETSDIIKGKDLLGRTQYVILNKDVVKGVGETNLKEDKAPEATPEAPAPQEQDAPNNRPEDDANKEEVARANEEAKQTDKPALPEFDPVTATLPWDSFKTADKINKGDRILTQEHPNKPGSGEQVPVHTTDTQVAKGTTANLSGKTAEVVGVQRIMGQNKTSMGKVVGTKVELQHADGTTSSHELYANRGGSNSKGGVIMDDQNFRDSLAKKDSADTAPAPEAAPAPEKAPETPAAPKAPVVAAKTPEEILRDAGVTRTEPVALPGEKFAPTRQQQDIIDSVLAGKDTAVQALAGSGKTSTLEALARRLQEQFPDKKIAYIAFNKSVQREAEGRMPGNVEAKTQHAVAYGWADKWMKDRSNDSTSLRRGDDVAGFLGIRNTVRDESGGDPMSAKEQAMAAVKTVDTFALSAEDVPDASHMPEKVQAMGPEAQAAVLDAANKIWADLNKPDGKMRYSLDHMRKQWALTKPDLSKSGSGLKRGADIIFMDEAQDTPKVMAHLMDQQTAQKVVVGDSNQNIYSSFTGSIDYMSQVQKDVELPLTKSWRFGPEVADIGNRFLELAEAPTRVEGAGASSKIVSDMQEPDAILVRSNAGMLGEILGELEKGRTVGVPVGTKKDLQSLVASAAFLKGQGDAPPRMHDDLAAYRTWDEVVAEADAGNPTMAKVANMVNTHGIGGLRNILNQIVEKGGDGLEGFVLRKTSDPNVSSADGKTFGNNNADYLKQAGFKFGAIPGAEPMKSGKNKGQPRKGWIARGSDDEQRAMFQKAKDLASGEAVDVTISTAHKSKGLEWNKVKIGDDFKGPKLNEQTGEVDMPSAEEMRLGYVAVTRAKGELDPGSLAYVFDHTQENGGIPKPKETNEPDNAKTDEQPVPTAPDDPEAGSDAPEEATPAPDAAPAPDATPAPQEAPAPEAVPTPEATPAPEAPAPTPEAAPAPDNVPEPAPQDAPPAPEAPQETPAPEAPEAPAPAPQDVPEGAKETPDGTPVASEEAVPEADQTPDPEPTDTVPDPETVPAPQELPTKEAPQPAPDATPAPEEAPAPTPESAPKGGTAPPEPNSKPLHPVKAKAGNYPDGTIIRDTQTGEAIEKTNGNWHVAGKPGTAASPDDIASPYVYDMPKQGADSFAPFEGIDSVGPGDILVTRKGTQVAVVGKRDGNLVVAPHNQTPEWRKSRPSLATIPPETVTGVNKFDATPASSGGPSTGGNAPTERKRTPFSSNRGNSNVTITDVGGNVIAVGDTVRTDMGTGKIVRVRPSDGPSGSAFVEFPDGSIKSFRSNKMRNTAAGEPQVTGGDDPAKMDIGAMGEAGDGRAFMVGKDNKPIFKGSRIALADGREGTVSGFAKGVQSVNLKMDDGSAPRKKASVVDVPGYTAPDAAPNDTTPEAPTPEATPEPSAPEAPAAPEEPTPAVINDPKESAADRADRIAKAISRAKDPAFLTNWWDTVMKDDLEESDIYEISPDMQWKMEEMFTGHLAREESGIQAARGWAVAAWVASKDDKRTPEQQAKMKDLQARITQFVQTQQKAMEDASAEQARQGRSVVRKHDSLTPDENMSLKSDRALKPQPSLKGAELDAYAGIEAGKWSGDLFGENSTLNVMSKAGKVLGRTQVIKNDNGNTFREGTKVYDKKGKYLGVVMSLRRGASGQYGANVRKADTDPRRMMMGGNEQIYNIERLMSEPAPREWGGQPDMTFGDSDTYSSISSKMAKAYPGVHFNFRDDIPIRRAKEYAETVSKILNKYPQLSATLNSVESSPIDPNISAFAYAATSNHPGLRDTKVVFNAEVGSRIKGLMQSGNKDKYFNNIPEGREMEYVMTHEFGHALDYMTGNISDNEVYELMKDILPPEVLGDKTKLGKYLFANGMVSEYSTEGNAVHTVELVAESFADVELNGANAKPISKLVHAELMKRIDEMSGGTGVIPGYSPTQAPEAVPAAV